MSASTLPRRLGHNYCWQEYPDGGRHCTLPTGHSGTHWHPYSKTSW